MKKIFLLIFFFVFLSSSYAAPIISSGIDVDEINLLGISAFNQKDLERIIEVAPGDRLERTKVIQTVKNLQELYRSAGYEAVKIETRIIQKLVKPTTRVENVLEIVISEGKPTRILSIDIEYDKPEWNTRLFSLSSRIGISRGDLYDREKLLNGYRSLQDALTGYDFLSAKVDETVGETTQPDGVDLSPAIVSSTGRWVKIKIKISLGERVDFGFRGNTVFANSQFTSWIDEQRLLGFSQDYVERLKSRFEDEYRRLGYDKIKIETFSFEDLIHQKRKITYIITEGPRVEIEKIEFDGNSVFSADILRDKYFELASPSVARGYFVAREIEKSAEVLIEWLKSQGYLAAKLVSISRNYRSNNSRVELVFYIYEGEQTVVDSISYEGLTVFKSSELSEFIQNKVGSPLDLYSLNRGLEKIKNQFRDLGYLDIKIKNEGTNRLVIYSQENRSAEIRLEIDEGLQYRVSKIVIDGLNKTKISSVLRELELKEDSILSESAWSRSEAKLRRLGIFASASIKAFPDPDRKNGKILRVTLEEGTPGLIAGGIGVRNDIGARTFGQISYGNLWGNNHTVLLTGSANRRFRGLGDYDFCQSTQQKANSPAADHCFIEYNISLGYVWPWFSWGETTFRPRISFERSQFINFDARTIALQMSWERAFYKRAGNVFTGVFAYSFEVIQQENANQNSDNQRLRIGSITPTLILDRRDSPLAPTRGTYTTLSWDLARPEFLSQNSPPDDPPIAYSRLQFRNDFFAPLPKGIDLFLSFRTGLEYNLATPPEGVTGSSYAIPLIKQYTLGGVGSLRGFREQSIFIDTLTAVRGSLTYVNYRAQLDLPFAGSMKIGPFIDAANLNLDRYNLGNLRYGVGGGIHYKSPVGPVNFDIGFNPDQREGEDSYQLHFSIGNI